MFQIPASPPLPQNLKSNLFTIPKQHGQYITISIPWAIAQPKRPDPQVFPAILQFEMGHANTSFEYNSITSRDGTAISYRTVGVGPDLIVLPGALGCVADYNKFTRLLSKSFTLHIVNRRGRGQSGPQPANYSIDTEIADLLAVQSATNAKFVFGHSYGGFIVFETKLRYPKLFQKFIVYEPGISIDGSTKVDWIPSCNAELEQGKQVSAFVTFIRGLNMQSNAVPRWILWTIVWVLNWLGPLQNKVNMLPTALPEVSEVARFDNMYTRYKDVKGEGLLLTGKETDVGGHGHGYATTKLAEVMKDANFKFVQIKEVDHLAPEQNPQKVVKVVEQFLLETTGESQHPHTD